MDKAKTISQYSKDTVLLSIEDNNKITGFMNIEKKGDFETKALSVFNNDDNTRKSQL